MRIAVVGAGAIGTYYAAKLASKNAVTLVVRRQEQVAAVQKDGLRITGLDHSSARVEVSSHLTSIDPDTLVVLTTKIYDSAEALQPIAALLRSDTVVLCLQNGLQSEQIAKEVVEGRCTVLRGITDFGVIFVEPGVVSLKARGPTLIEQGPGSATIAEAFTQCELDGRASANIKQDVWRKLVVNCVINPLTAMTGMEVGWVSDERLDPLKRRIIDECLAIAACDGIVFDVDVLRMLNDRYRPSRNLSSMCQDLARGKRTEIEYMNGAVVELGRRYGIPCPVNESLVTIVKALEQAGRASG